MALDTLFNSNLPLSTNEKQKLQEIVPETEANNPLWLWSKLPASYVESVIKPAIRALDEAKLVALDAQLKGTGTKLSELVTDIRETTVYVPRDGNALPAVQEVPERLRSSFNSGFKSTEDFIIEVANLKDETEKENALMAKIIASANRSAIKFDRYVLRGDGQQFGNEANDLFEVDSWNRDIKRPASDKKISHDVENVSKITFTNVLNDIVSMAKAPGNTLVIDGETRTVGSWSRIDKLAYLASWMSALEEGCNKVLPSLPAEIATNAITGGIGAATGFFWDVGWWIAGSYPVATTALLAVLAYTTWKTWSLVKGVLNIPSVGVRAMAKAVSMVPGIKWAAPYINRGADIISFADRPMTAGETAGGAVETPSRYTPVTPHDLSNFNPGSTGENSHEEYRNKTLAEIEKLRSANPPVEAKEVARRVRMFRGLDAEYTRGSISAAEYLTRTEAIMRGEGRVLVRDPAGKIDAKKSMKRVGTKIADRITKGAAASGAESIDAIAAAKNRMKGMSYTGTDLAGNEVKFENPASKALFEEFRDKIKQYSEMQEWDANDRKRANLEARRNQIQTTEIPAKQSEINLKAAQISVTPQTIPGTPMVVPGASPIPTQLPNPLITTLNAELSGLQSNLSQLNGEVNRLNGEIATIRGNAFSYIPAGNDRGKFHEDIKELKRQIVGPGGLIERINAHIGGQVKAIPDTFFNPKNLKIDHIKMTELVGKTLRK